MIAIVAAAGASQARSFEAAYAEKEQRHLEERLEQMVDAWEGAITDRVQTWLGELAAGGDVDALEQLHRARNTFFDAYYVWEGKEVTWPPAVLAEDLPQLRAQPCVERATEGEVVAMDAATLAERFLPCLRGPPGVALFAGSEAAEILLNADQPAAADVLIRSLAGLGNVPLAEGARRGLPPRRLAILRLQHARSMAGMAHPDVAQVWLYQLATEILWQGGPALEETVDLYDLSLADDLRAYGGLAVGGEDDDGLARARRRLAAWREVRDQDWPIGQLPGPNDGPRLFVDPFGDPPWLLFVARLGVGGLVGGVQLDQPTLIQTFYQNIRAPFRNVVSIRDGFGRVLAGAEGEAAAEASFRKVLPHLRLVATAPALADPREGTRALLNLLAPFLAAVGVGALALWGLVRTDRQQVRLIERQREFVARVTHELKTPLAGIRLMAENLEMGAFRDDAQREKFARQIIKEAERLGMRVDEVLRSNRVPVDEHVVDVDLDVMFAELGERWRALFGQQGGSLQLDFATVGAARVRPGLIRDAVTNLLDNALKYGRIGTPVVATLRVRGDRQHVTVEVDDNGIGVPADRRKIIFQRFARVEGADRGKAGGHGLGLAFVADAVRAHGGRVECRELPEGGSRFTMRFRRSN
jgi:signal transduction histidine kinase